MEKVFYFLFFPESQNLPLKFGKIEKKMQKPPWGFEPPLMWTQGIEEHALDHLATQKT